MANSSRLGWTTIMKLKVDHASWERRQPVSATVIILVKLSALNLTTLFSVFRQQLLTRLTDSLSIKQLPGRRPQESIKPDYLTDHSRLRGWLSDTNLKENYTDEKSLDRKSAV